jgi:hypothetical protein
MSDPEAGAVDFMYLLDRLEEALVTGSRVPLMARTLVDEQECLDILDQMRVAMPTEIKEARRVIAERDHILAQAREETERIVRDAINAREEADKYAETLLTRVQERLEQALTNVRAGLRELETGDVAPR